MRINIQFCPFCRDNRIKDIGKIIPKRWDSLFAKAKTCCEKHPTYLGRDNFYMYSEIYFFMEKSI